MSIENLKLNGFEEISIINYLLNIGSSEDIKPETDLQKLIENFDLKNISSSSSKFSDTVLMSLNTDVLKNYNLEQIINKISLPTNNIDLEKLWTFSKNNITFLKNIEITETVYWYIENNRWVKNVNKSYNFKRLGLID